MTVTPAALVSIAVSPPSISIPLRLPAQLLAMGTYTDGTQQDLTTTATWLSANTGIATVSATGEVTPVTTGGPVAVSASLGTITGSALVTVLPPVLQSIVVKPGNAAIALGTNQQYQATGQYSDGSTQDLTTAVTWSSGTGPIATISPAGLANSIAVGSTTITASSGTVSGSTTITVTPAQVVSIAIIPRFGKARFVLMSGRD